MTNKWKMLTINVSKKSKWAGFLFFIFILLNSFNMYGQPQSGMYSNECILSFNKDKMEFTGFLLKDVYVDYNPQKGIYQSCNIFFKGNLSLNKDSIDITVFDSFDINPIAKGKLSFLSKNEVEIKISNIIISCQNMFDLVNGEKFVFSQKIPIIYCTRIKEKKAFFYNKEKKKKSYLVSGDFVSVMDKSNILLKIIFFDKKGKIIKGWIKESDVE